MARLTIADRRPLHGWLRRSWAQTLSSRDDVLVSVDPSVKTVYGAQRGARRGYNPKRRGAKSYFPLVAYDVDRGEVIDAALRPGNWNLRGLRAFLLRLIDAAGAARDRLIMRLDRGCSGDQVFSLLEAEGVRYVAKVEANNRLKAHAAALPAGQWKALAAGAEIASFRYLAKSWGGSRRVVAVRRVERDEPDALFAELAVVYSYDFYVTTLAWKKERVVAAYHRGSLVEAGIKELFEDLAALATTTSSWRVNAALLLVGVLAQRVLSRLRRTALPAAFRTARIRCIRFVFLDIGARIASHARCLHVRLDRHYPWRTSWYRAWQALTPPAPT
ncbi:MAG: transposase [Thermoanaerobaculia bacterium]